MRAFLALLIAVASVVTGVGTTAPADAAVLEPFQPVFSAQTNGKITITGNNNLICPDSAACTSGLDGTATGSRLNNNGYPMVFQDRDSDSGTVNSTSAGFTLPTGARVLYAGLYWGAAMAAGTSGKAASTATVPGGGQNLIEFRTPGQPGYGRLTADHCVNGTTSAKEYACRKDVTAQVTAAGSGQYWGADIWSGTGNDRYAGWSLVVVVEDGSLPLRDLTVFNGFAGVGVGETVNASISGFRTPPAGAVGAEIGVVAWEGDQGSAGDYLKVNSTALGDSGSPTNNFFSSRITDRTVNKEDRNPANPNNLGVDAKTVDASGIIGNNATSANLTFGTTSEVYYPVVLTTQVDLYAPVITSSKTVNNLSGNDPVKAGDTLEYSVAYTNTGQDDATAAVLTDPIPAGTSYVPGSLAVTAGANTGPKTDAAGDDQAGYDAAGRRVVYRVGTGATATAGGRLVSNGGSTTVSFRVTVDTDAADTTVTNVASLAYTGETLGKASTAPSNPVATPVAAQADLSVTKSGTPASVIAGENVQYTITAHNAGPNPATGVTVVDSLPAGTIFVSATPATAGCSPGGGKLTCALGTVGNGATTAVTVTVRVNSGFVAGAMTNVVDISGDQTDPNLDDNHAVAATDVTKSADLQLTKTASATAPVPGESLTYTITARNDGPSDARTVRVSDALPAAFTQVTATSDKGSCTVNGGEVHCDLTTLPAGQAMTVTITGTLDASYTNGPLTNNATATSVSPDPDQDNNSATVTVTPTAPQSDLSVTKTLLTDPVVPGQLVQYRIVTTNAGPSDALNATVTDDTPASLSQVSANPDEGSCAAPGGAVTCQLGTIPANSVVAVVVTGMLDPAATGSLSNSATAATDSTDLDPDNNTGTSTSTLEPSADLQLTKTYTPSPVTSGSNVSYLMTVTNNGSSTATAVVLTDPVPAPLTFVSATPSQGSCSGTDTVTCSIGSVAPGATATVIVVAATPGDGSGNAVVNTATVQGDTPDPNPDNNSATATLSTAQLANITLTKSVAQNPVVAGGPISYTITAHNAGPSQATAVTITDTLPSGIASGTFNGPGCTLSGRTITCTQATLNAGADAVVTFNGTVSRNADPGSLTNSANVTSQTPTDPTPSDNTSTVITNVIAAADLTITKSGPATATAGNQVSYTLVVHSNGPSQARDVTVTDVLPVGATLVSATGAGADCALQPDSERTVGCSLDAVEPNDTMTITVLADIDPDVAQGSTLTNAASVSSATPDPTPADNRATVDTAVDAVADLVASKTVTPDPLVPGREALYTVTVHNAGPSTAVAPTISDTVPAGLGILEVSTTAGDCEVTGQVVSCDRPTLGAIDWIVQIRVAVAPGLTDPVTNHLEAASDTTDPNPGNNSQDLVTQVAPAADLEIVKTAQNDPMVPGQQQSYLLTVVNHGPSTAQAVTVADTLAGQLSGATASVDPASATCTVTGQQINCDVGALDPGANATVTVTGTLDAAYDGDPIDNTATAASVTRDVDPANNTDTVQAAASPMADVSVAKSMDPAIAVPGESVRYTLLVTNAGPSVAAGTTVTDTLPAGLTDITATAGDPATTCTVTGRTVDCALGDQPVGQQSITVIATLDPSYGSAPISNTASVATSTADPDPANNTSAVTGNVVQHADLAISKTLIGGQPMAGKPISYRLVAVNNGPSTATRVAITDELSPFLLKPTVSTDDPNLSCTIDLPPAHDNLRPNQVICTAAALTPGKTLSVTVSATLDSDQLGSLKNTGMVSSATDDPDIDNNDATVVLTPKTSADLQLSKTATPTTAVPGKAISYRLTVTNKGPSTARNVDVTDDLADALTAVTARTQQGRCTIGAGNAVSCRVGDVRVGRPVVLTLSGIVPLDFTGNLDNSAALHSDTPDPVAANNTAVVRVAVGPPPAGEPPVARPDSADTGNDTTVTVDVLGNDTPSAGAQWDPATVCLLPPAQGLRSASAFAPSAPNCLRQYTIAGTGSWQVNQDGTITFSPAAGFSGTATIGYSVTDTAGFTATSTLSISVTAAVPPVNPPPATPPGPLPNTGIGDGLLRIGGIGLLLAAAGVVLLGTGRRRVGRRRARAEATP